MCPLVTPFYFLTAVLMHVLVRYGAPISISATSPSFLKGDYHATTYFLYLSINSPNWNTLYAARVARNITPLWAGTVMDRHMYSNLFRGACSKAHILLRRPVNTITTKSNLPASLFNLNPPRSNTTPYYTTLQPCTPHTPPLFQHRHRFPPAIISAALLKNPSRSPHSISQQRRKELSKA